ncbi:rhodanese-like domain-containing protein [Chloroflexus sp.]|uniref:rhodanese-like domain-containing protein n=1 Tax=Chloroflexus sp. TaxID=1904827 RepID=UPI00404B2592
MLAGAEWALNRYRPQRQQLPTISLAALQAGMPHGDVYLLDVRPLEEFAAGHLPGAVAIPLAELPQRIDELPVDKLIVTYCRGPLCRYADETLLLILASGRRGARLEEGVAEWLLAGYPLAHS